MKTIGVTTLIIIMAALGAIMPLTGKGQDASDPAAQGATVSPPSPTPAAVPGPVPPSLPALAPGSTQSGGTTGPDQGASLPAKPRPPLPVITISAQVDQAEVPSKDTLTLTVTLEWEEPTAAEKDPLDFDFPEPPAAAGMVLYANSFKSVSELHGADVRVRRIHEYKFYADQKGETMISPVTVRYGWVGDEKKQELSTQPIKVTITRSRLRAGAALRHPATIFSIVAILVGVLGSAAWGKLAAGRREKAAQAMEKSPYELARERLQKADRYRMAGDYAEFLIALGVEIRRALEVKFGHRVKSGHLSDVMPDGFRLEFRDQLDEFEKISDKVKFAGYAPGSDELDEAMETAREAIALLRLDAPAAASIGARAGEE